MSGKKLRGERKTSVQAETPEQSLQLLKWEIENNYKRKRDEALNFKFHWDKGVYDKDLHEDTLDSLWKVAGEPYIKQYPPGGLMEAWKEKYDNPQTWDRAFATQGAKTGLLGTTFNTEPDTIHVTMGDVSDTVAELPHPYQYKLARENGTLDELNQRSDEERRLHGEKRYDIPGTVEHEAHKVIEKEFMDAFIKNEPPPKPLSNEKEDRTSLRGERIH